MSTSINSLCYISNWCALIQLILGEDTPDIVPPSLSLLVTLFLLSFLNFLSNGQSFSTRVNGSWDYLFRACKSQRCCGTISIKFLFLSSNDIAFLVEFVWNQNRFDIWLVFSLTVPSLTVVIPFPFWNIVLSLL